MARRERRYVLDTNLFIDAFRNAKAESELLRFHAAFAPFEFFSSIVAFELRVGALTRRAAQVLESAIVEPFERRGRIFAPTWSAWKTAGAVLASISEREKVRLADIPKSFVNDVLLAASCRETGLILITGNIADFSRIRRYLTFEFLPPWPVPVK